MTTQPTPAAVMVDAERETFERWFFQHRKESRQLRVELFPSDANSMWEGWQARATHQHSEREAELERLREALRFYADSSHYCDSWTTLSCGCCSEEVESEIMQDEGKIARATLDPASGKESE